MSSLDLGDAWSAWEKTAIVVPGTERAALEVRGSDRKTWLNGLVTCEMAKLPAGAAAYGLAVGTKGRILADLYIADQADRVLLFVPAEVRESLRTAFEHYLVMEDAETALTDDSCSFVHGPLAGQIAEAAKAAGAFAAPLDLLGGGGALIAATAEQRSAVDAAVDAALTRIGGRRVEGDGTSQASWDAVRIARAIPRWSVDFDTTHYPQEASLEERAVSFQKGCYLGQEVVCMLQLRGHVSRKLVPLELPRDAHVDKSSNVQDEAGADVGKVTSVAPSPTGGTMRAMALVKYALATPGQKLVVAGHPAVVAPALG